MLSTASLLASHNGGQIRWRQDSAHALLTLGRFVRAGRAHSLPLSARIER